jgi:DNA-binding response OmpR family regulator
VWWNIHHYNPRKDDFSENGMAYAVIGRMDENTNHLPLAVESDKPLILVVEDDEDMREWVVSALAEESLKSITAASVAEAIAVLQSNRVALTVLDWGLDRCGAEVLRVMKQQRPEVLVLVMSGLHHDVRTDAMVEQADAFLEKPFSATVLKHQVLRMLRRAEDQARAILPRNPEDIRPLSEIKELYIRHVVGLLNDNISLAAEKLGIHRQTVSATLRTSRAMDPVLAAQPA